MNHKVSSFSGYIIAGLFCLAGILIVLPVITVLVSGLSFGNLVSAFADPERVLTLFYNSMVVTIGTVSLALVLGGSIGFLCFRTNLPFRRVIMVGCLLAACVPLYITATCWMALVGMQFWLSNSWGASFINGIAYTPLVALITGVCFAVSSRELEESTALDAGKFKTFWYTTLPLGAWGIGMAAVVVAILSVWDITVTDILMVRTFAEEIFTQFQLGVGHGRAAAVSLPVVMLLFVLCIAATKSLRLHGKTGVEESSQRPRVIDLGNFRYLLLGLVLLCVTAFFVVPFCALVKAVVSLENLMTAWRTSRQELLVTLKLTPIAATICVVLALVAAWTMDRTTYWRWVVYAALVLLIAVPAPIVGIGLIQLLNRDGLSGMIYDSSAGVVLAYVIRALPFGVLALLPAMRRIPKELEEIVVLEGGNWIKRITSVVIPLSWQAVIVAWLLCFVVSISEIGASFLVVPPGRTTLSIRFFTLIHYGVYPDAAGVCLILLLVVGLTVAGIASVIWPKALRKIA